MHKYKHRLFSNWYYERTKTFDEGIAIKTKKNR